MGNVESSGSYQKHLSRFLPDELMDIEGVFSALSGADEAVAVKVGKKAQTGVTLEALKVYVKDALPPSMVTRLYSGMMSIQETHHPPEPIPWVAKEQFVVFASTLFKGNAQEKSGVVLQMVSGAQKTVKGSQILEFAGDLISSVIQVLSYRKLLKGWNPKKLDNSVARIKALATQLTSELKSAEGKKMEGDSVLDATCDRNSLEDWLFRVPQISTFLKVVLQRGLLLLQPLSDEGDETLRLLPACRGLQATAAFVSLLDLPSITYLNSHLPSELRDKWQLVFASGIHGESFSQLCGHIVSQGPCLLVLKDTDGHVFGGFSSCSWEVKPQFQGNNTCFLFSVSPSLAVFTCSGYNNHYMYLNHGQQTMPNGLGMGGQHEYFGLWVDSNFGQGHSRAKPRCTTYNSPQLSAKENFLLDSMEVWAVGDTLEAKNGRGQKSILDTDPEAQALLEMMGKSRQSDGFRKPPDDDGEDN
ncbi:MTOR-associated protein MEAK7 [Thamnophis elegans]|uniref:MTOR-associated protein MEAK7 n=1 Tax=Thamnophis elegans TaxID=35005 RepID=UPI00137679DF|nr:MTOR-associated protein MEAK7 [Thamnophis elegans]XP_032086431.1 MTOR-associated protein MEAK7 [Thamnophis elegans]XP_032086432.1 MTOR-associated protein MEAK7 [Thamnophis elegans]